MLNLLALLLIGNSQPALPSKYLPIPTYRQQTDYSCGPASLLPIFQYWQGYQGKEQDLYGPLGTDPQNGTEPGKLHEVALTFGLKSRTEKNLTLDSLRSFLASGETAIVDYQAWGVEELRRRGNKDYKDDWENGHYSVVVGIDAEYIYFMDPSTDDGYGYLTHQDFLDRWHDVETVGGKTYGRTVIISGTSPLIAPPPVAPPVNPIE